MALIKNIQDFLSKYLPLSGGAMTGDIDLAQNKRTLFATFIAFAKNYPNHYCLKYDSNNVELSTWDTGEIRFVGRTGSNANLGSTGDWMTINNSGVTVRKLIKSGGTSSQFLKADGSVDSNTYLTAANAASLVSLDDLKEVLTTEQFNAINAKVQKRIAKAQAEQQRILEEIAKAEELEKENIS